MRSVAEEYTKSKSIAALCSRRRWMSQRVKRVPRVLEEEIAQNS